MPDFCTLVGKLIKLNKEYPIYSSDDDRVIGHTSVGDMAVITSDSSKDGNYFEATLTSGEYAGVDSLALNNADVFKNSTFILNKIDGTSEKVSIKQRKIKYEYV